MEKPYVRENDKHDYCARMNMKIEDIDTYLCDYFERFDSYG